MRKRCTIGEHTTILFLSFCFSNAFAFFTLSQIEYDLQLNKKLFVFLIPTDNKHLFDWIFFTLYSQFSLKKKISLWFWFTFFLHLSKLKICK